MKSFANSWLLVFQQSSFLSPKAFSFQKQSTLVIVKNFSTTKWQQLFPTISNYNNKLHHLMRKKITISKDLFFQILIYQHKHTYIIDQGQSFISVCTGTDSGSLTPRVFCSFLSIFVLTEKFVNNSSFI